MIETPGAKIRKQILEIESPYRAVGVCHQILTIKLRSRDYFHFLAHNPGEVLQ